jgi:YVTN family beta-propeller protein
MAGVPKAQVQLTAQDGHHYSFTTNSMGNFEFDNLPIGTYTMVASRPGVGQATTTLVVDGKLPSVSQMLNLTTGGTMTTVPMPVPGGLAPTMGGGPSTLGKVYIALAAQKSTGMLNVTPTGSNSMSSHNNSFGGSQIPGPPAFSQAAISALMYNGGDPWLLATGHKRPDIWEMSREGHVVLPASTAPRSIMRMDANNPAAVQYAAPQSNPYWMALNGPGSLLFVSTDQQTIEVYNTGSASMVGSIPAGGTVTDVVCSPDGNWIFAADSAGTPGVIVIDANSGRPVRFLQTPRLSSGDGGPACLAVSPDSRVVYVTISSPKAGEVLAIDTVGQRVLAKCPVGRQPLGLGLTPDGRLLFCANNAESTVSVIDVSRMAEINRIHVGIAPTRIAVKPDGTKAYVTCRSGNCVAVISGTSPVAQTIPVAEGPTGIAITPDGRKAVVADTAAGSITIIDTSRDVVEHQTSAQVLSRPFGVVIGR